MPCTSSIVTAIKDRQCAIRRELDRRNVLLKVVAMDSGVPYSSLLSYFPEPGGKEPAAMPVAVLYQLIGVIPDELLSLLLPTGRQIVRLPDDLDHDAVCEIAADYIAAKAAAHRVDSPAGVDIAPCEKDDLDCRAAHLRSVA